MSWAAMCRARSGCRNTPNGSGVKRVSMRRLASRNKRIISERVLHIPGVIVAKRGPLILIEAH
jgi:hypothetical protein